jgi:hypothetical protein
VSDEKRDKDEDEKSDAEAKAKAKDKDEAEEKASEESEEAEESEEDPLNPEAIARRVAALGEEDEVERLAREEERKLAERRASKKKGKKGGLEVAASKKLAKIGQRAEPKRTVAVASDADPLIERTAKLSDWAKKNQKTVQLVGALIAVALLGVAGFMWYQHKRETEASVLLAKAVDSQRARIGEPPKEGEEDDHSQYYKTYDERREAALKQYREVQQKFSGTGASILARLAEGSMLLDKRDADGAIAAYNDVKASPLAAADHEVRGRALEGLGFAHELKATAKPEEKDKHFEEALKVFKELESTVDVKGFKEMAMYHQARVLMNKGDKDKAKELLLSLKERLNKPDDTPAPAGMPSPPAFPYLKEVAMDRLREIDPEAAPKQGGMPGGGQQLTPAQIKKMMEDMQKKQGGKHP